MAAISGTVLDFTQNLKSSQNGGTMKIFDRHEVKKQ